MSKYMTIGDLAKRAGFSAKTVRFYEEEGILPPARRSPAGYRLYTDVDLARLQFVRRIRILGLSLPATKALVDRALSGDCALFGEELMSSIAAQRDAIVRQIVELEALHSELDALDVHVRHCCEGCDPRTMASECCFCGLIESDAGGSGGEGVGVALRSIAES